MANDIQNAVTEASVPTAPEMPAMAPPPPPKPGVLGTILGWPASRKMALAAVAAISVAVFAVIILQARTADYQLLFANLSNTDASSVVEWLKERKIPYRLDDGGRDILIPADKVYESRLALAGAGLPTGGGVGFEIFDKQNFGTTDFAQKVNYRRAMQGELARTITSLAPVEAARVHLALPERRLFAEDQQQATASVIVKMGVGGRLKDAQIQGIVHLVSGSVEGLEPGQVTVVDAAGRVLTETRDTASLGPLTPGMLEFQQAVERRLEKRGQSLLDRAVGVGNGLVRVTADVDFSQREKVEESFDPNATALKSESAVSETSTNGTNGSRQGVQANLGEGGSVSSSTNESARTEESASYEVSKVTRRQVDPVGTVNSLSVSVLLSDRKIPAADGKPATTEPRTEAELKNIEAMISTAIGIDAKRGDQLSVVSMAFETGFESEAPMMKPSAADQINNWMPLIKYVLLAIGALVGYLLLLKPMLKTLQTGGSATRTETREVFDQYRTVEELESELRGDTPLLAAPDDFVTQLRREITKTASTPTQVIKAWLNEG